MLAWDSASSDKYVVSCIPHKEAQILRLSFPAWVLAAIDDTSFVVS